MATVVSLIRLAALGIPAFIYAILTLFSPAQYAFSLETDTSRVVPAVVAATVLLLFAVCSLALVDGRLRTPVAAALLAVAPLTLFLFDVFRAGSTGLAIGLAVTGLALVGASRFAKGRASEHPWVPLGAMTLVFAAAAISAALDPFGIPRAFGASTVIAVFISFAGILVFAATLFVRVGLASGAAVAIALLVFPGNDHSLPVQPLKLNHQFDIALSDWLDSRADLADYKAARRPYPVVLVSAEGGGIYAAAHAYQALSIISARCPTFAQHVFALVGVSGGAVGNALFAAGVDPMQRPATACTDGPRTLDTAPVTTDHFSPLLARFLLLEPLDRLWPGRLLAADRAMILAESFRLASASPDFLETPLHASWDPTGARPALISVATDMWNGSRYVMSPVDVPGTLPRLVKRNDMRVVDAAVASARFPLVTPTARFDAAPDLALILADGGYYENSGAETVVDIATDIRLESAFWQYGRQFTGAYPGCAVLVDADFRTDAAWHGCDRHIFIIHLAITGTQADPNAQRVSNPTQSFLFDPLTTILESRRSRAALALLRASEALCGTGSMCRNPNSSLGFFRSMISPTEMGLPLGWHLSPVLAAQIAEAAIPSTSFRYLEHAEELDDIAILVMHFDLSLELPNADPSSADLLGSP